MTADAFSAAIQGVVEGLTEFIPVSSTGHLLITQHVLKTGFSDLFMIVIQSGAVLAVIPIFRRQLARFVLEWRVRAVQVYLLKLLLAFGITAAGGLLLDRSGFHLPEDPVPIAVALVAGGVAFLAVERWLAHRRVRADVSWLMAAAVGVAQIGAAAFPGASRSGATILILLVLGLARPAATEFSFLVGVPTMLAAGLYKLISTPRLNAACEPWTVVAVGFLVSALVSFAVVKWLLAFVQTHTFRGFGWYRIGFGLLLLAWAFWPAATGS